MSPDSGELTEASDTLWATRERIHRSIRGQLSQLTCGADPVQEGPQSIIAVDVEHGIVGQEDPRMSQGMPLGRGLRDNGQRSVTWTCSRPWNRRLVVSLMVGFLAA